MLSREVCEGWTVSDYVDELSPLLATIQANKSIEKPITTKEEMRRWLIHNQPHFKREIPELVTYFCDLYKIPVDQEQED